jgi:hypothetical protein
MKTKTIKSVVVIMPENQTPVVGISPSQVISFFDKVGCSKIITLETLTVETQLRVNAIDGSKEKCNYKKEDVLKHCLVNGIVGGDYETAVNRQLVREGKEPLFKAKTPVWGNQIGDGKSLETHEKQDGEQNLYVAFRPMKCLDKEYQDIDGKKLDETYLKRFIAERPKSSNQGTDKEIPWRKYKLSSIKGFNYGGVRFIVVNDTEILDDIDSFIKNVKAETVIL